MAGHRCPYKAYVRYPYYGSRHRTGCCWKAMWPYPVYRVWPSLTVCRTAVYGSRTGVRVPIIVGSEQAPAPCRLAGNLRRRGLFQSLEMRQDVKSHISRSILHGFPRFQQYSHILDTALCGYIFFEPWNCTNDSPNLHLCGDVKFLAALLLMLLWLIYSL